MEFKKNVFYCVWGAGLFLTIGSFFVQPRSDAPLFVTMGILFLIVAIIWTVLKKIASDELNTRKQYITFNGEEGKLIKRGAIATTGLAVEKIDKVDYKFNPAELVYTGATVGGVTTGGFHINEAYYQEIGKGASGKAYIINKGSTENDIIKKITLTTPDLIAAAKSDKRVSKFLKGDALVLQYDNEETKLTKSEQYVLQQAVEQCNQALQYSITQRAFLATHLKTSECHDVLAWLRGE